jgi:hypothetical protein
MDDPSSWQVKGMDMHAQHLQLAVQLSQVTVIGRHSSGFAKLPVRTQHAAQPLRRVIFCIRHWR